MSISASEARKTLFPLIERVNADRDAVERWFGIVLGLGAAAGEHHQPRSRRQRDLQMPADMQVTSLGAGAPTCGYPGSPAHASVTFNTSQVVAGTAASYTCDNGYELLGPPRRLCQANGTWSPAGIPFCGK